MAPSHTFLDLVNICDNFHIDQLNALSQFDAEELVPFTLTPFPKSPVIGLIRPVILVQLRNENERSRDKQLPPVWEIGGTEPSELRVSFASWLVTPADRTNAVKELCERWRDTGLFEDIIGPNKWRDESYPVYKDPFGVHDNVHGQQFLDDKLNYAFEMERAATALFGIVTYGVHMTIYCDSGDGTKIWVPTRAKTKQTWPGYLDNSVAGGIPSGIPPFEAVLKESMEEANITEDVVRKHVKAVGAVSYFTRTSKGWLQPEVEYVYDLAIPADADPVLFTPKPLDGEVESFELLPVNQVIEKMCEALFKPNCAVVLIDFFIRHGYITPDTEPNYVEIITRLHGRFDHEKW